MTDRSGGPAETEPRIEVGLLTDVGRMRTGNEDSIHVEPIESRLVAKRGLFCAVADGMGGHAAGEIASSLALQTARDAFYDASDGLDPQQLLRDAVIQANTAVYEAGAGTTGRDHMGTTLTAAVVFNHRVVVGHVGDSRCYIVSHGHIRQLSRDHSWVAEEVAAGRMTPEQARHSPRRNIITRALGLRPDVDVDSYHSTLEPNDIIVICSDGLHGLVEEDEISDYVRRLRPADAVDALVNLANQRGGPDNISVVVARVNGDPAELIETSKAFLPLSEEDTQPTERANAEDLLGPPPPELTLDAPTQPASALSPTAPLSLPPVDLPPPPDLTPTLEVPPPPELTAQTLDLPVQAPSSHLPPVQPHAQPAPADYFDDAPYDEESPTPRHPMSEMMLARVTSQPPEQTRRRGGGTRATLAFFVVILLMIIVGTGIAVLIFVLTGLPLPFWPASG